MTIDQCQSALVDIRRRQGTRCPWVRVAYAGTTVLGRLARSDSDPEARRRGDSPYGLLVLEPQGLRQGPATVLQIADIPTGGLFSHDG